MKSTNTNNIPSSFLPVENQNPYPNSNSNQDKSTIVQRVFREVPAKKFQFKYAPLSIKKSKILQDLSSSPHLLTEKSENTKYSHFLKSHSKPKEKTRKNFFGAPLNSCQNENNNNNNDNIDNEKNYYHRLVPSQLYTENIMISSNNRENNKTNINYNNNISRDLVFRYKSGENSHKILVEDSTMNSKIIKNLTKKNEKISFFNNIHNHPNLNLNNLNNPNNLNHFNFRSHNLNTNINDNNEYLNYRNFNNFFTEANNNYNYNNIKNIIINNHSKNKNNNNNLVNCLTVMSLGTPLFMKETQRPLQENNYLTKSKDLKNNITLTPLPRVHLNSLNQNKNQNTQNENKKREISKTFCPKSKNIKEKDSTINNIENKLNAREPIRVIKKIKFNENKIISKNKNKKLILFDTFSVPGTDNGAQKINQDTYLVIPNFNGNQNIKIFGVFDGHGANGDYISQELRDYFLDYFKNNSDKLISNDDNINFEHFNQNLFLSTETKEKNFYNNLTSDNYYLIKNSIYKSFSDKLHQKYSNTNKDKDNTNNTNSNNNNKNSDFCQRSGTTSNLLIVINDPQKDTETGINKIISTNLGDSKSILITDDNKVIELNKIHIPEDEEEKKRIIDHGGEIGKVDWSEYGPLRIWFKGKNYPGLSMTRSFGDFESEPLGVISEPDVKEYGIDETKIKMIVMASDGVWQFMTNEKVKNILLPYYEENDIHAAGEKLVKIATKHWKAKNPNFIDDITVVLLFFK